MVRYYVKTDGASRGNPGHSGYGCVLENEDGDILAQLKGYINDKSTNNESEYIAAAMGLTGLHQFINENPEGYASFDVDVTLFSDSELQSTSVHCMVSFCRIQTQGSIGVSF